MSEIPAVKIVAGPARSGKTLRLLGVFSNHLRSCQGNSPSGGPLWIGPTQQAVSQLRDQLVRGPEDAFLAPSLYTFAGFADAIIARSQRRIHPLSRLQKRRLLQQVISNKLAKDALPYFKPVASTPGFLAQVDETIAELKRRDIWAEDFLKRCRHQRDRDMGAIYKAYQRQLVVGNLYDAEGRFWAAREALTESDSASERYGLIVVDGFTDFTAAQHDILKLLAERTEAMQIVLTLEQDCVGPTMTNEGRALLFARVRETLWRLGETLPGVEIEWHSVDECSIGMLDFLRRELFRDGETVGPAPDSVEGLEIIAASSVQREIEEVGRRIKTLLQTGRVKPQVIGLVYRGGDEVAERIARVCEDFGIPVAIAAARRLSAAPIVRLIDTLLRLEQHDWPFRLLLSIVNNRLIQLPDEESDASEDDWKMRVALERCLRAAQLPSGKKRLLEHLKRRANDSDMEELSEPERDRIAAAKTASGWLRRLADKMDALPATGTLGEWIAALEQLLSSFQALPAQQATWSLLRRGLRAILVVDSWAFGQAEQFDLLEMQELVELVARETRLSTAHDDVGRVSVLAADSARHRTFDHLFLVGLEERAFSGVAERGRLVDEQVLQTSQAEPYEPGPPSGDAMLLFHELITRANKSVTLSFAALDEKGQALPPSPMLIDVERCCSEIPIHWTKMSLGESCVDTAEPRSRSSFRRQAVESALNGESELLAGMLSQADLLPSGSAILAGLESIALRSQRDQFGAFEGVLLSDAVRTALAEKFGPEHLWSPSQLESYATCPYRFYAEQLLKLEPQEDFSLCSDARRRGSLLHHVLATIHRQLRETDASCEDEAALVERFQLALEQTVAATPLSGLDNALREIERREIDSWATQYAEQETDYRAKWELFDDPVRPTFFELRFGSEATIDGPIADDTASTELPFVLDLGEEQIRLTGQIDRIDVGRIGGVTVFTIIDYKSGKEVKFKEQEVTAGRQLQLPLYAMAAERLLLADQGAVALATNYWSIQGKGFGTTKTKYLQFREAEGSSLRLTKQWQKMEGALVERVRQIVDGIRRGEFPVYNEDKECTHGCALNTICRVAHIRSLEKEWVGG